MLQILILDTCNIYQVCILVKFTPNYTSLQQYQTPVKMQPDDKSQINSKICLETNLEFFLKIQQEIFLMVCYNKTI